MQHSFNLTNQWRIKKYLPYYALKKPSFTKGLNVFILLLFCTITSMAQTSYPQNLQQWTFIAEEHDRGLEAMYTVDKCDTSSVAQINLIVFNEKSVSDTIDVEVTIYKNDFSDSTSSTINSLVLPPGAMLIPKCGSNQYSYLKISSPSTFDPKSLRIKVKFNY